MSHMCDLPRGCERAGSSLPAQNNPGRYQAKAFPGPETFLVCLARGRQPVCCGRSVEFQQYRILSTSHEYSKGSKQVLVLLVKLVLYFTIQLERVLNFSTESSRTALCLDGRWCFTADSSEWDSAFGTAWDGVSWFCHHQSPHWLEFAESRAFLPAGRCVGLQEGEAASSALFAPEAGLLRRSCRTE